MEDKLNCLLRSSVCQPALVAGHCFSLSRFILLLVQSRYPHSQSVAALGCGVVSFVPRPQRTTTRKRKEEEEEEARKREEQQKYARTMQENT